MAVAIRELETNQDVNRTTQGADLRDPIVFGTFYDATLPVVYGYVLRRTGGHPAVAEDLTQETFLAAVRQIKRGAVVDAPLPWLIGIARHKVVDHYRSITLSQARWQPLGVWAESLEDERDDFVAVLDRQMAIAAFDAMPPAQRLVLALRYLDDLSVPEIARAIEKSVHAVESLLARGRASFKRMYLEHGHE